MREKTERNRQIALEVLEGDTLTNVGRKHGISFVAVEHILVSTFRKLLPGEEKIRYYSGKAAAKEYNNQLRQALFTQDSGTFNSCI